jgi:hypothetical protein
VGGGAEGGRCHVHSVRGLDLAKKTGKEAWPPQARAWETAPLGKVRTFLVAKGSETAVAIGPEKRPMDTPPTSATEWGR